jgi:hypothetical protein
MWVIATYEATSLFSLKPATSTASGGKTLLVPTPYAIKMALLDVACRLAGPATAALEWETWLRDSIVALKPPSQIVVNNTFIKVLKPRRDAAKIGSADYGYFQRTITYREYAYMEGPFGIALWVENLSDVIGEQLSLWLTNINYLGKRGSFMQISELPTIAEDILDDFIIIDGGRQDMELDASLLTQLDDTGEKLTFEAADIYSSERITLGKQRILRHVVLPYQLVASSRGYSYYRRSDV